jgi:hypothetical protein
MTDEINTNQDIPELSDELQREVKLRFELLPEDVQKVITDSNYVKDLFEIAKANKLTYEQLEALQLETIMAFLGMNKPENYRAVLKNQLQKSDAEMDVLISAINEKIFDPIKESMKKVYGEVERQENGEDIEAEEPIDTEEVEESASSVATPGSNFLAQGMTAQAPAPENLPVVNNIPIRRTPVVETPAPVQNTFVPANSPSGLSNTEENVLGKAGVVIGTQNTVPAQQQSSSVMPDRNDLMKGIENPVKSPSSTIMANKLSTSTTLMPNKTTDYTLPRTTPQSSTPVSVSTPTSGDSYREPI